VTPEDQVPRIATTRFTSMSFFAARTAASGSVWLSSVKSRSLRPRGPPAAFTCSTASAMAFCIPGP